MGVDLFISPNCDLFLKWGNYTMVTSRKTGTIKSNPIEDSQTNVNDKFCITIFLLKF